MHGLLSSNPQNWLVRLPCVSASSRYAAASNHLASLTGFSTGFLPAFQQRSDGLHFADLQINSIAAHGASKPAATADVMSSGCPSTSSWISSQEGLVGMKIGANIDLGRSTAAAGTNCEQESDSMLPGACVFTVKRKEKSQTKICHTVVTSSLRRTDQF
ncbi:uncharacterized protein AB9X84_023415 isoform 2-T2 [Acanthopagrus schlegelii]